MQPHRPQGGSAPPPPRRARRVTPSARRGGWWALCRRRRCSARRWTPRPPPGRAPPKATARPRPLRARQREGRCGEGTARCICRRSRRPAMASNEGRWGGRGGCPCRRPRRRTRPSHACHQRHRRRQRPHMLRWTGEAGCPTREPRHVGHARRGARRRRGSTAGPSRRERGREPPLPLPSPESSAGPARGRGAAVTDASAVGHAAAVAVASVAAAAADAANSVLAHSTPQGVVFETLNGHINCSASMDNRAELQVRSLVTSVRVPPGSPSLARRREWVWVWPGLVRRPTRHVAGEHSFTSRMRTALGFRLAISARDAAPGPIFHRDRTSTNRSVLHRLFFVGSARTPPPCSP